MENLFVEIVSPSGRVFRGEATGVKAPGVKGSFEVLRNHAPMISAFEVGLIRVTVSTGEQITFATSGGFLEVINNSVSILAETAEIGSEIDIERAQAAEEQAVTRLAEITDSEERKRYEAALIRARNRVRIAMGEVGTAKKH
ncbi:MAG: ATP synthase F1 subunit epsilon [Rhodothermia bacterium]|nr:MAG: ATP synthase F1 subunit epsilon [Rhodothermia bacterium]